MPQLFSTAVISGPKSGEVANELARIINEHQIAGREIHSIQFSTAGTSTSILYTAFVMITEKGL